MVREANMKQAASEKQLKEARGKVGPPSLAGADLCFPSRTSAGLVQPLRVGKPGTGRVGPGCWRWPLTAISTARRGLPGALQGLGRSTRPCGPQQVTSSLGAFLSTRPGLFLGYSVTSDRPCLLFEPQFPYVKMGASVPISKAVPRVMGGVRC